VSIRLIWLEKQLRYVKGDPLNFDERCVLPRAAYEVPLPLAELGRPRKDSLGLRKWLISRRCDRFNSIR